MRELQIESANQVVRVSTNSDRLVKIIREDIAPRTIIPGMNLVSGRAPNFTLVVDSNSKKEGIDLDKKSRVLSIHHKPETTIPKYPLIYALFYTFNRAYQEAGIYPVHGSAISKNGKGVLVLGHEDYGKSRIALKLCLDYGFTLNGDETILMDNSRRVISGGQLVQMSKDKINYYFPNKKIAKKEFNEERDKEILDSSYLGFFNLPGSEIKHIFYGHVCPYAPRFVSVEEGDARRRFFENVSENIRGHGYALLDIDSPYPSLDTTNLAKRRMAFVKDFIRGDKIKVYTVRDNLENICTKILGVFENDQ